MSAGMTFLRTFLRHERDDEEVADALLLEYAPTSSSNASNTIKIRIIGGATQ